MSDTKELVTIDTTFDQAVRPKFNNLPDGAHLSVLPWGNVQVGLAFELGGSVMRLAATIQRDTQNVNWNKKATWKEAVRRFTTAPCVVNLNSTKKLRELANGDRAKLYQHLVFKYAFNDVEREQLRSFQVSEDYASQVVGTTRIFHYHENTRILTVAVHFKSENELQYGASMWRRPKDEFVKDLRGFVLSLVSGGRDGVVRCKTFSTANKPYVKRMQNNIARGRLSKRPVTVEYEAPLDVRSFIRKQVATKFSGERVPEEETLKVSC
jgi:hypothetical protein